MSKRNETNRLPRFNFGYILFYVFSQVFIHFLKNHHNILEQIEGDAKT